MNFSPLQQMQQMQLQPIDPNKVDNGFNNGANVTPIELQKRKQLFEQLQQRQQWKQGAYQGPKMNFGQPYPDNTPRGRQTRPSDMPYMPQMQVPGMRNPNFQPYPGMRNPNEDWHNKWPRPEYNNDNFAMPVNPNQPVTETQNTESWQNIKNLLSRFGFM